MNKKNFDKSYGWKNWIIKKLLTNESTKEDILNFIANQGSDNDVRDLNDNNEKSLIKNILQLNDKSVEDLMVPRSEIVSLDYDQTYREILDVIKEESHSRMPVYKKNLDNVVGFLHVKDFIKTDEKNFDINLILREVLYVAPKSPILDFLETMRSSKIHLGLVVDGVGGVNGLVTIEDLVEEIVGDIEDEHDAEDEEDLILNKSKDSITVNSNYRIEDLENYFNLKIAKTYEDEVSTIGGLVYSTINRIPKNNEAIKINENLVIKILKSNSRKIEIVEIKKIN
ncbi:CBS domain-containing protein [Pelagibacteraceae bacterium]|nr:CBS domain-containing protein [Pelagibacteraceae bacterium]